MQRELPFKRLPFKELPFKEHQWSWRKKTDLFFKIFFFWKPISSWKKICSRKKISPFNKIQFVQAILLAIHHMETFSQNGHHVYKKNVHCSQFVIQKMPCCANSARKNKTKMIKHTEYVLARFIRDVPFFFSSIRSIQDCL